MCPKCIVIPLKTGYCPLIKINDNLIIVFKIFSSEIKTIKQGVIKDG